MVESMRLSSRCGAIKERSGDKKVLSKQVMKQKDRLKAENQKTLMDSVH